VSETVCPLLGFLVWTRAAVFCLTTFAMETFPLSIHACATASDFAVGCMCSLPWHGAAADKCKRMFSGRDSNWFQGGFDAGEIFFFEN